MVTMQDLYTEAERFLEENYGLTLTIPIDIVEENELGGDIQGAFECTKTEPYVILLADFVLDFADDEVVYDVLRHELVHYAMFMLDLPYYDGDEVFEAELAHHGIASSGTTRVGRYHIYECAHCHAELPHWRRFNDMEKRVTITECCDAEVIDTGRQAVYNGKERVY